MTHQQTTVRTLETLYRLALLAHGDALRAEQAVWPVLAHAPEGALLLDLAPRLLPRRWRRPRPHFDLLAAGRAGLTPAQRRGLLAALALLEPAQRLALGLLVLRGLSWAEAAAAAAPRRTQPLLDPRPALGQAMELLPDLDEQPPGCRRVVAALLADQGLDERARQHLLECPSCRAVRQGWGRTGELLREAVSGLFVVPPEVLDRLAAGPPAREARRWGLLALVGGVALLLALLLLRGGGTVEETTAPPAGLTTDALIERVIARLDEPLASGSVVHEIVAIELPLNRFRGGQDGLQRMTMERWYDYGPPARVRLDLRSGNKTIYTLTANGQQLFQMRRVPGLDDMSLSDDALPLLTTAVVSPELERQLLPLLRQPYAAPPLSMLFGLLPPLDVLGSARANPDEVKALGSTSALGRPAWLLSVQDADARRTLLTIDQETYAVLDVHHPEADQGEVGHSWRTTRLEVLSEAPAELFMLAEPPWDTAPVVELLPFWRDMMTAGGQSSPGGDFPADMVLPDPSVLPSAVGALGWHSFGGEQRDQAELMVGFWAEYGFGVLRSFHGAGPTAEDESWWTHEEGGRRFRVEPLAMSDDDPGSGFQVVVDPQTIGIEGAPHVQGYFFYPLATPEEREELARALVRGLRPADPELRARYLQPPP